MGLLEIRKKVDEVDKEILGLIVKRLKYMDYIRDIKLKTNMPILDMKRKKHIFDSRVELAKKLEIEVKFSKKLMKTIIAGCKKRIKTKK